MNADIVYIILFVGVCLFYTSNAECTVKSAAEQKYLSLLDPIKGKTLTIRDTSKNYTYDIGICTAVKTDKGADIGCYQNFLSKEGAPSTDGKTVGMISQTDIKAGTDWILLTYMGGETYGSHCLKENRRAVIMIVCDPENLIGTYSVTAENTEKSSECYYLFEISSSAACSSSSLSSSGGISVGSIISIIFFTLLGLYIIVGVLYQRCVVGAKGMEQVPHLAFWRELGNLIADGADFMFRTKPPAEPRSYKGIGDDQLEAMDDDDDRDDHLLPMY